MLGINRIQRGALTYPRSLLNMDGCVVTLDKGEHFNLLSLNNGAQEFFGLQNEAKGLVLLPTSLFSNNFKIFQKEI